MLKTKINYAPDTIFIIGTIGSSIMLIQNSKSTQKHKASLSDGIENHCQKCKEIKLAILN